MISRHDGKNSGSIRKLWIKLLDEISDTNTPVDPITTGLTISDDISLTGTWEQIEVVVGEASWQEVQSEDETGQTYTFSIQMALHKDRQEVTESLMTFAGRKLSVIAQDRNDNLNRLLGEKGLYEYHARLTYSQVKEKSPGRNSYDITIQCEMHHPACYYTGAVAE